MGEQMDRRWRSVKDHGPVPVDGSARPTRGDEGMSAETLALVALAVLLRVLAVAIAWVVGWPTSGDGQPILIVVGALFLNFVVAHKRAIKETKR